MSAVVYPMVLTPQLKAPPTSCAYCGGVNKDSHGFCKGCGSDKFKRSESK